VIFSFSLRERILGICSSGDHNDLQTTDRIAAETIKELSVKASGKVLQQFQDNADWITHVEEYQLVVGSEARILYLNADVRI
jgi:urocanate hydratase